MPINTGDANLSATSFLTGTCRSQNSDFQEPISRQGWVFTQNNLIEKCRLLMFLHWILLECLKSPTV